MSPDAPNDQSPSTRAPGNAGWTISDSEWNGFVERCTKHARRGLFGIPLLMFLPTALCAAALFWLDRSIGTSGGSNGLRVIDTIFWFAIVPMNAAGCVIVVRRMRRHAAAAVRVRGEDGCVCPACCEPCAPRTPDGFAPRCRHGVSRDARDALVECWQGMARRDIHAVTRMMASLPDSAAPRGIRARLSRAIARASSVASDVGQPFSRRYRAGLVHAAPMLPFASFGILFPMFTGRSFPLAMVATLFGIVAAMPLFLMSGAARATTQERCRACRQLMDRQRPPRCPECGTDLTKPAAIESVARPRELKYAAAGGAILLLAIACTGMLGAGIGVSLLPTRVLTAISPYVDSRAAIAELESRQLSAAERSALVEVLIRRAAAADRSVASGSVRRSSNVVLPAVVAGDLPGSTIDDALRAMVRLSVRVERTPAGDALVLTPSFGDDLFDRAGDAWVVFRGVSFDGAAPIGASTNPIDRWSVDPIWRSGFQRESHPTAFTVPCPAGARSARWQATVVLLPFAQRPAFSLEADGRVSPSPNAIGSVDLEGTIEIEP